VGLNHLLCVLKKENDFFIIISLVGLRVFASKLFWNKKGKSSEEKDKKLSLGVRK
jgi:hypothetical protein